MCVLRLRILKLDPGACGSGKFRKVAIKAKAIANVWMNFEGIGQNCLNIICKNRVLLFKEQNIIYLQECFTISGVLNNYRSIIQFQENYTILGAVLQN